jgi:hypothetical protein
LEQQKKYGKLGGGDLNFLNDIINIKSIRIFESTTFYRQIIEAQDYLLKNEAIVKGWLNINLIKEFMILKLEIDLNYIDLIPSNSALFGFNIEEPLVITFSGKETKFLNAEEDKEKIDFKYCWDYGMLDFAVRIC